MTGPLSYENARRSSILPPSTALTSQGHDDAPAIIYYLPRALIAGAPAPVCGLADASQIPLLHFGLITTHTSTRCRAQALQPTASWKSKAALQYGLALIHGLIQLSMLEGLEVPSSEQGHLVSLLQ